MRRVACLKHHTFESIKPYMVLTPQRRTLIAFWVWTILVETESEALQLICVDLQFIWVNSPSI